VSFLEDFLLSFSQKTSTVESLEDFQECVLFLGKSLLESTGTWAFKYSSKKKMFTSLENTLDISLDSPCFLKEGILLNSSASSPAIFFSSISQDIRFFSEKFSKRLTEKGALENELELERKLEKSLGILFLFEKQECLGAIEFLFLGEAKEWEKYESFFPVISSLLSGALVKIGLLEKIKRQFLQVCEAIGSAIVQKDSYTGGHTKRVGVFAGKIARECGLKEEEILQVQLAAVLHDVGKIGIEDKILKKKAPLDFQEFLIMKQHPHLGFEILKHIEDVSPVVDGIRYHHERPDGKGYPYGLKEGEIPLIAEIVAVADAFDAMISTRPYRKGLNPLEAYEEIMRFKGIQFGHTAVEGFERFFLNSSMYRQALLKKNRTEKEKEVIKKAA